MSQPRLRLCLLLTLLCLSGCNAGPAHPSKPTIPAPFGHLDAPNTGTTVTGPTIEVRGWVLDSSDTQPSITLSLDGKPIEASPRRVTRNEVCKANPAVKNCVTSKPGFGLALGTARFADGSHTIAVEATNKDGSAATIATQQFSIKKKTCLVLSVGEARGLAHIGAIDALKEAGIRLDCVAGNSMGALVGGLYATAPDAELKSRYQNLMAQYTEMTKQEVGGRAILGALIGGLLTGGVGALVGGAAGAGSVSQLDRPRFTRAMDAMYEHASIENLPVPFATSFQTLNGNGMGPYTTARTGPLALAVSCSVNNALIFKQDLAKATCLDPGTDRPARVPVDEACKTFKPARIIAINVTGEASFSSREMNCDVKEAMIDASDVKTNAMLGEGPDFEHAYTLGYETTKRWLITARLQ